MKKMFSLTQPSNEYISKQLKKNADETSIGVRWFQIGKKEGITETNTKWKQAVQKLKEEIKENCELEVNENGLIMIIDKIFGGLAE